MRVDEFGIAGEDEVVSSPFASFTFASEDPVAEADAGAYAAGAEAPFESFFVSETPFDETLASEADQVAREAQEFLEALHDEDFESALEEMHDEGAAFLLADAQRWPVAPAEAEVEEALTQWMAPLVTEWEHTVDGFAAGLETADLETMSEAQLDELLESLQGNPLLESEFFGRVLRGLANKVKGVVKQAVSIAKNPIRGVVDLAKQGVNAAVSGVKSIGKHLIGPLLGRLKRAGLGLLKGVLKKLIRPLTNILPAAVRPFVPILTKALGLGEVADEYAGPGIGRGFVCELSDEFDHEVASMLYGAEGPDPEFAAYELDEGMGYEVSEAGRSFEALAEFGTDLHEQNPLAELDHARARLATELTEWVGENPVVPIQEFIPAVLAIRPLLKLGLKVTGARDKLIELLANPLASLIRNIVGPGNIARIQSVIGREPDKLIARAGVGLAFTALGLESAEPGESSTMAGEAVASAVEATVHRVLDELSSDELQDPLQVSAAVQRAFAEAAAAYLPDRMLRADLPERETADEGGMWVLMPRATRPRYRFRKYSRTYAVPISLQTARLVRWSDGGTLEGYLRDRGVTRWPVAAEVDLYETLPGTAVGHLTRDESLPVGEDPGAAEFQPLTMESAGLLLREPMLGRRLYGAVAGRTLTATPPGQRYFRIRVGHLPGARSPRPRRPVTLRWEPSRRRLRVGVRLSERRARALTALLQRSAPAGQRDLPAALSGLREALLPLLRVRIAERLLRSGYVTDPAVAARLASSIAHASSAGLSRFVQTRGAELMTATTNAAEGVTILITFAGVGTSAGQVPAPEVSVLPGWVHA